MDKCQKCEKNEELIFSLDYNQDNVVWLCPTCMQELSNLILDWTLEGYSET
jgi:hypothetical protein